MLICPTIGLFLTRSKTLPENAIPDGKKTKILDEGSGVLHGLNDKDELVQIEVKGLKANLLSEVKLAEKRPKVDFDSEDYHIVDSGGAVVSTGHRCAGLH